MGSCSSTHVKPKDDKRKPKNVGKKSRNGARKLEEKNGRPTHENNQKQVTAYQDIHHSLSGVQKISVAVQRSRPFVELTRPSNDLVGVWTDEGFTLEIATQGLGKTGVEWKRPKEFATDICLFQDGASKFDVGQGSVGTCWFLCMLAAISDKDYMMKQIFPKGESSYDQQKGIYHCRLWDFGQWVDIYCDDFLPVKNGKPWGARSATFKGEMWVPFLEKALAKYCGSYSQITGGLISRAFRCLTGGITEQINQDAYSDVLRYFNRAKNALASGAIIGVVCEKAIYGLVSQHAYTLTGAVRILYQDKPLELLRVRNPWGRTVDGRGEWTGPWSDKAPHWQFVDERTRSVLHRDEEDGEFWMSLTDFMHTFSTSIICNVTPDFDKDGTCDGLDNVCTLYGDWQGQSAAGYKKLLDNPLFIIDVPAPPSGDSRIPLVMELMQYRKIMGGERHDIKCYVFKLTRQGGVYKYNKSQQVVLEEKSFLAAWEKIDRLLLEPGQYMLIPSTFQAGCKGEFLLRIFSEQPFKYSGKLYKTGKATFTTEVQ